MKFQLSDIAFLILVKIDSVDRLENTLMIVEYLSSRYDTEIHVWEYGVYDNCILSRLLPAGVAYAFHEEFDLTFHRTRYINQMVQKVTKPFVAIWDADVLVPFTQIDEAVAALRRGADLVYPYNSRFYNVSHEMRTLFMKNRDMEMLESYTAFMNALFGSHPVGGAYFVNMETYKEIGLENEAFYGWGLEDGERYKRFESSGKCIVRIKGNIYHLSHPRNENSCVRSTLEDLAKRRLYFQTNGEIV